MRNIKIKNFLYLLVSISAIAWLLLSWFSNIDLSNIIDFIKIIPKVVTIDAIIVGMIPPLKFVPRDSLVLTDK